MSALGTAHAVETHAAQTQAVETHAAQTHARPTHASESHAPESHPGETRPVETATAETTRTSTSTRATGTRTSTARGVGVLAAASFLVALTACPPSLSEGRAYRCTPDAGTAQCAGWACRLDGYCHDPELGEALPCGSTADCGGGWFCGKDKACHDPAVGEALPCGGDVECGGGWFCGKDGTCHDPLLPAELPCDEDRQCAGGWRCSTEGLCVDPGPPGAPVGHVERLVLVSPLRPAPDLVSASPVVLDDPNLSWSFATATDHRLDVTWLAATTTGTSANFRHSFSTTELGATITDLALSWPTVGLTFDAGTSLVLSTTSDGTQVGLYATAQPARFWPMAVASPDDGLRPMAVSDQGELHVVWYGDGGAHDVTAWSPKGAALIDVASTALREPGAGTLDIPLVVLTSSDVWTLRPSAPAQAAATTYVPVINAIGGGTTRAVAVRATALGLGVAFERLRQGTREPLRFVAVTAWDTSGALPVPPVTSFTDGGAGSWAAVGVQVCSEGETLADFALLPPEPPSTAPGVEALCLDVATGRYREYRGDPPRPVAVREPGVVDGRSANMHAFATTRGHLVGGDTVGDALRFTLSAEPDWMGLAPEGAFAALGRSTYGQTPDGLLLNSSVAKPEDNIERIVEAPVTAALYGPGYVVAYDDATDASVPLFVLTGQRTTRACAGAWLTEVPGGQVFSAGLGDAVFSGARDGGLATAAPTTRPAPGFDLTSLDVTARTDAGQLEGWAVANARLFHLVARSADRWSSTELPLRAVEPLTAWFDGERGWLATSQGQVLAIPERVPVSAALGDGVSSVVGACGTALAVRDGVVFELGEAGDGGLRAWREVSAAAFRDSAVGWVDGGVRELEPSRLYRARGRVWVASASGMVYELRLTGCAP